MTTEPTNEALIASLLDMDELSNGLRAIALAAQAAGRITALTERAEKAEATMERLGLVEDVTFDAADNSVSEWKNIRAEAAEAELAALKVTAAELDEQFTRADTGWALASSERDSLKAELARTREALTWAMDEIDELANVACGFAYPQAMTIIGRKSQSDAYFAACAARRAALAKKEHTT